MNPTAKSEILERLRETILDPSTSEREWKNAQRALSRLADQTTITRLVQEAQGNANATDVVLRVLDILDDRRTLNADVEPLLIGFLYDDSPAVRQKALSLLGNKGSQRALASLDHLAAEAEKETTFLSEADLVMAREMSQQIRSRTA
jgi:HEAT repeat protein